MKLKTINSFLVVMFAAILITGCKNEKPAEKNDESLTTNADPVPAYDPEMDPVKVEAKFIKMLGDTLGIKFFEGVYQPGDSVDFHAHPDHILYILEGSTLEMTVKDGTTQTVELKTGMGMVSGPVTHKAKIIGPGPLRLVAADIYRPRK